MSIRNTDVSVYFHVHLVSDSTGETLVNIMKASCAQFRRAIPLEHLHTLVRTKSQMDNVLNQIENKPGVVLYTLTDPEQRKKLEVKCDEIGTACVSILDPSLAMLGRYLGASMSLEVGAQRTMDSDYYQRIAALDYAMAHDDGQNVKGLAEADIVLLGVSRTSKTPTCMYLAHRGYKAGNIPLVPGAPLPAILDNFKKPFIVGLVASPDRLVQIREQRLVGLNQTSQTNYIDKDQVRLEVRDAKRMFLRKGIKVIDVTRRSIEETAAQVINLYNKDRPIEERRKGLRL